MTEAIDELRHDNDIRDGMCDFDNIETRKGIERSH